MHDFLRDGSGEYGAIYRSFHLIGLEIGVSVASAVLRGEATGSADSFIADVVAVAKKDLKPGEILDGEGGYSVFGRLVRADESLSHQYLPLGLSRGGRMIKPVAKDAVVNYHDVALDENPLSFRLRKQLEMLKEDR
jgi:predicted homoserine dehydrogenase-like protein